MRVSTTSKENLCFANSMVTQQTTNFSHTL